MIKPATGGRRWVWAACWLLATGLLLAWYRPFRWEDVVGRIRAADPAWMAAALAASAATLVLWILQWAVLRPPNSGMPFRRVGEIVALTAAAANTVPLGGGHAIGFGLLAGHGRLGLAAATSLMVIDQLSRGIVKVALLYLAIAAAPVPEQFRAAASALSSWVLVLAVVMAVAAGLAWLRGRTRSGASSRWVAAAEAARRPGPFAASVALVLAIKVCEGLTIYCVQRAAGQQLALPGLLLILLATNIAGLIQLAPGNIGVYEAAVFAACRSLGMESEPAMAMAVLVHACHLAPILACGYSALGWRALRGEDDAVAVGEAESR